MGLVKDRETIKQLQDVVLHMANLVSALNEQVVKFDERIHRLEMPKDERVPLYYAHGGEIVSSHDDKMQVNFSDELLDIKKQLFSRKIQFKKIESDMESLKEDHIALRRQFCFSTETGIPSSE